MLLCSRYGCARYGLSDERSRTGGDGLESEGAVGEYAGESCKFNDKSKDGGDDGAVGEYTGESCKFWDKSKDGGDDGAVGKYTGESFHDRSRDGAVGEYTGESCGSHDGNAESKSMSSEIRRSSSMTTTFGFAFTSVLRVSLVALSLVKLTGVGSLRIKVPMLSIQSIMVSKDSEYVGMSGNKTVT